MKKLNKEVFHRDESTDVISLPVGEVVPGKGDYLGEVVVNQDEVKRNALEYKVSYAQELARVVTHGVLHLLGYEDDTEEGRKVMEGVEDMVVKEIKSQ